LVNIIIVIIIIVIFIIAGPAAKIEVRTVLVVECSRTGN